MHTPAYWAEATNNPAHFAKIDVNVSSDQARNLHDRAFFQNQSVSEMLRSWANDLAKHGFPQEKHLESKARDETKIRLRVSWQLREMLIGEAQARNTSVNQLLRTWLKLTYGDDAHPIGDLR